MPPSAYGTFLGANDDGTVDIFTAGRKMRVSVHPEVDTEGLERGQEVALNESLNVVLARASRSRARSSSSRSCSRTRTVCSSSGAPTRSGSPSSRAHWSGSGCARAITC